MDTRLILWTTGFTMFGFLAWYALAATLRHPKTLQVQFDICPPYANRFYRRRMVLFLLYVVLPILALYRWELAGPMTYLIISLMYNLVFAGRTFNITEYPEIRIARWTAGVFIKSALTRILQVVAVEFMFRGLVLHAFVSAGYSHISAVLISGGLYALTNYFRTPRFMLYATAYGFLAAYMTTSTGSLLPAIIVHLVISQIHEVVSVMKHPEMRIS